MEEVGRFEAPGVPKALTGRSCKIRRGVLHVVILSRSGIACLSDDLAVSPRCSYQSFGPKACDDGMSSLQYVLTIASRGFVAYNKSTDRTMKIPRYT